MHTNLSIQNWFSIQLIDYQMIEKSENLTSQQQSSSVSDCVQQQRGLARRLRQDQVGLVESYVDESMARPTRRQRSVLLFTLEVIAALAGVLANAYMLIEKDVDTIMMSNIIIGFLSGGIVICTVGNLQVASPVMLLKLTVHLDTIMPAIAAHCSGFFTLLNWLPDWVWQTRAISILYPAWMLVFAATLRVHILCECFSRWKLITYKIMVFANGVTSFYVGWSFMKGAYRVTNGFLPELQNTYKNIIYLYIFGMMDFFFELVKRLTDFDQTSDLKASYQLKSAHEIRIQAMQLVHAREAERDALITEVVMLNNQATRTNKAKTERFQPKQRTVKGTKTVSFQTPIQLQ